MNKYLNTLKKIGNVLSCVIIALLFAILCIAFISKLNGGRNGVLGWHINVIASGSMDPKLKVDDIIISRSYKDQKLEKGDIVTYIAKTGEKAGQFITHEIIHIDDSGDELVVITKGIAAPNADAPISGSDIVSVMVYKTHVVQYIYKIITNPIGFMFFVILPLLATIGSEIYNLIKELKKAKEE